MTCSKICSAIVLLSLCSVMDSMAEAQEQQNGSLKLEPQVVEIEMLYSGTDILASSWIPEGYDVVITCQGKESPVELKRKGRALGFLWMNVGDIKFENVPLLYLLRSTKPLKDLAKEEELEKIGVGFRALEAKASSGGHGDEQSTMFGELIKLKKSEGLFNLQESGVDMSAPKNGMVRAESRFHLSAKTAPGTYEFKLFIFKEGHGKLFSSTKLEVTQIGTSAFIASLAHEHGLLYGILAAIIAIFVGLLTGVAFSLGSKSGH